jgi:hypothetical protein
MDLLRSNNRMWINQKREAMSNYDLLPVIF